MAKIKGSQKKLGAKNCYSAQNYVRCRKTGWLEVLTHLP